MNCPSAGYIRNDNGSCVPVESYLSTGSNKVYWVSQVTGNDANAGTKDKPWKTIARANRAGQLRAGDAVVIRSGTYREVVRPITEGRSGAWLSFVAYPGENVVVSGAELANSGWSLYSGKIYKRAYNYNLATDCPFQTCTGMEWRRDMLIADGKLLKQVGSIAEMTAGTFYVNGNPPSQAPTTMYAWFPNGYVPSNFTIEIGKEPVLFLPTNSPETCAGGDQSYYRIIGLTFRYAVGTIQTGAVCPGTQRSIVEEITVEKTNAYGIRSAGLYQTFRGNVAQDNGQGGMGGGCDNCLLEYNATLRNNWRNHNLAFEQGGGKFAKANNTTIRYHLAMDNNGIGMWFDNANENNVVENSMFVNNVGAGIWMEMNSKYNVIRNNLFYGTRYFNWTGAGILSHAASYNIYQHNTIINNEGIGLWIRRDPGNRAPEGHNKIFNNLLINNGTSSSTSTSVFKYEIYVCSNDNELNGNQYWTHTDKHTFFYGPAKWAGDDLSTWRSHTKQDGKAGLLNVNQSVVENRNSYTGFRLTASSQAIGRGAALPVGYAVPHDFFGDNRPSTGPDAGAHEHAASGINVPQDSVATPPTELVTIGESGSVTIGQAGPAEWHTVTLENSYTDPIVVAGGLSSNGADPAVVRVRNVTANSFDVQIDEWDYLDGGHGNETVNYLVVESGKHTLPDGTVIQAGTTTAGSTKKSVPFVSAFEAAPVVLSQVVTTASDKAVTVRQSSVSTGGFQVYLQGQELNPAYGTETLAWIAMEKTSGTIGTMKYRVATSGPTVTETWKSLTWDMGFTEVPVFVAAFQTSAVADPVALRYRSLSATGVEVKAEEDQSKDQEVAHGAEGAGYIVIDAGAIVAQSTSLSASLAPSAKMQALDQALDVTVPTTFALEGNYPNPFNPQTTIKYQLAEAAQVRLEVFDVSGRRVALLVDEAQSASVHQVSFDARDLPSGMYLYRLQAGSFVQTNKMILVK